MRTITLCLAVGFVAAFAAAPAAALSIPLSSFSSDATPASTLDATIDLQVIGGDTLQLTLTNDTTAPDTFNINQVFWNGSGAVSSLSLVSATHSVENDVTADWMPVQTGQMANGFGTFDFALMDGVGETDPSVVGPTEWVVFVLSIGGSCADSLSCTAADFVAPNGGGYTFAAKFVNGPDDPENPGYEDSAYGAIPEPGTALLLGIGLTGLALQSRRQR